MKKFIKSRQIYVNTNRIVEEIGWRLIEGKRKRGYSSKNWRGPVN